jgi:hypothetical protein
VRRSGHSISPEYDLQRDTWPFYDNYTYISAEVENSMKCCSDITALFLILSGHGLNIYYLLSSLSTEDKALIKK